jgi:hypothetical protein
MIASKLYFFLFTKFSVKPFVDNKYFNKDLLIAVMLLRQTNSFSNLFE